MTYQELWRRLVPVVGEGEARAVVRMVLDDAFGLTLTDIYSGKVTQLSAEECSRLEEMMRRLELGEPVQYVLGWADFGGRRYAVGPGVLIPRPETEDLCDWIEGDLAACGPTEPAILDVGTGSGCIASTLALDVAGARVEAWDISTDALRQARANATRLGAQVTFAQVDALRAPRDRDRWHVVVSNPPYITPSERADMTRGVLDYEPHGALFVPADDPLCFHRAIGRYAIEALKPGGAVYFELNTALADDTARMLRDEGFAEVELRRDRFDRPRMVKARVK